MPYKDDPPVPTWIRLPSGDAIRVPPGTTYGPEESTQDLGERINKAHKERMAARTAKARATRAARKGKR